MTPPGAGPPPLECTLPGAGPGAGTLAEAGAANPHVCSTDGGEMFDGMFFVMFDGLQDSETSSLLLPLALALLTGLRAFCFCSHACLSVSYPPNFGLSRQKRHVPQSLQGALRSLSAASIGAALAVARSRGR